MCLLTSARRGAHRTSDKPGAKVTPTWPGRMNSPDRCAQQPEQAIWFFQTTIPWLDLPLDNACEDGMHGSRRRRSVHVKIHERPARPLIERLDGLAYKVGIEREERFNALPVRIREPWQQLLPAGLIRGPGARPDTGTPVYAEDHPVTGFFCAA